MEDWRKRAAVLIAGGLAFGVILFAVKSIRTDGGNAGAPPAPEPVKIAAEEKPTPPASRPAEASAPAAKPPPPVITPTPPRPRSRRQAPPSAAPRQSQAAKDFAELMGGDASQSVAFMALFRSPASGDEGEINRNEIEKAVREYIERYRSYLDLSPSDYGRLIDLVTSYRETNLEVRSALRTPESAEMLKLQMKEMKDAMDEFRKITDPRPQDLFGAEASTPPPFGEDLPSAGQIEDIEEFFRSQPPAPKP